MRCMGCQPTRARTECESSSADRKSCEINGLYRSPNTEVWALPGGGHGPPAPLLRSGHDGLAQASQASAATSPMEFATLRVSSIMGLVMQVYGRNPSKIIWSA